MVALQLYRNRGRGYRSDDRLHHRVAFLRIARRPPHFFSRVHGNVPYGSGRALDRLARSGPSRFLFLAGSVSSEEVYSVGMAHEILARAARISFAPPRYLAPPAVGIDVSTSGIK